MPILLWQLFRWFRGAPRPAPSHSSMSLGFTRGLVLVRHLEQVPKPPQLTPYTVKEQWLYSKLLLSDWASHSIFQAQPSHPELETYFSHLYPALLFSPWTQTKAIPSHRAWLQSPCYVWGWAWLFLLGTSQFLPGNTNLNDSNTQVFFYFYFLLWTNEPPLWVIASDLFVTCFGVMAPNKITHRIIWHTNPATTVRRVFKEGEIIF